MERIVYGEDGLRVLPAVVQAAGASRVFLVSGRSVSRSTPVVSNIVAALRDSFVGLYDEVSEHAGLDSVLESAEQARAANADLILGVGGGSAIDAGRVVAVLVSAPNELAHPGSLDELRRITRIFKGPIVPFVTVPTTLSAAGSNWVSAVTDDRTRVKDSVGSSRLKPFATILDGGSAQHTPEIIWASTGIKAIDHCVELVCSPDCNPVAEALCVHAFHTLLTWLPRSVAADNTAEARLRCLVASAMTLSWTNVRLGVSHALAHQIGARLHVPHGVTSCVTLPAVMSWSLESNESRLAALAGAELFSSERGNARERAESVVKAVKELVKLLGLETSLAQYSPTESDLDAISELAHRELSGAGAHEAPASITQLRALLDAMSSPM
ncbi:MAG: iron-containing alcohol dehydrogenase [Dehalococcoidia bacterium]